MRHLISTFVMLLFVGVGSAIADDDVQRRTIAVSGSGAVSAAPDEAEITVGVATTSASARDALSANNAKTEKVFEFLRATGLRSADMQSTDISVSPQFRSRRGNEPVEPEILGYTVRNNVRITVRDLDKFGEVLDGVVSSGVNILHGIRFDVSERKALELKASANAVDDAFARARNIAKAAGIELGAVLQINEGGAAPVPRQFLARAEASSVPVAPGELMIGARVSVVFAIE